MLSNRPHINIGLCLLLALLSVGLLSACDPEAKYATRGVELYILANDETTTSSKVEVEIVTQRDVYYYCDIIPDTAFNHSGLDYRFMQYVLDSVYSDYLSWRRQLLYESSPYIASFSSHCLSYGNDKREFSNLMPQTDYLVYAFCVNPETNKPMGQLFTLPVHTDTTAHSSLSFTYSIEHKSDGVWFTIEPTNDDETYLYDLSKAVYVHGHSTPENYLLDLIGIYKSLHDHTNAFGIMHKGFEYINLSGYCAEDEDYYIIVVGYDNAPSTPIGFVKIHFQHDMDDVIHADFIYSDNEE